MVSCDGFLLTRILSGGIKLVILSALMQLLVRLMPVVIRGISIATTTIIWEIATLSVERIHLWMDWIVLKRIGWRRRYPCSLGDRWHYHHVLWVLP